MGRPPILTMEMVAEAEKLIGIFLHREPIAAMLGISKQTLYDWLKRGAREKRRLAKKGAVVDEQEEIYVAFLDALKKGAAEAEKNLLLRIESASERYWQAAAWKLERSHPERWGQYKVDLRKLEKAMEEMKTLVRPSTTAEETAEKA